MSIFTVEGELKFREKPESLIGQYGIYSQTIGPYSDSEGDWIKTTTKVAHSTSLVVIEACRQNDGHPGWHSDCSYFNT